MSKAWAVRLMVYENASPTVMGFCFFLLKQAQLDWNHQILYNPGMNRVFCQYAIESPIFSSSKKKSSILNVEQHSSNLLRMTFQPNLIGFGQNSVTLHQSHHRRRCSWCRLTSDSVKAHTWEEAYRASQNSVARLSLRVHGWSCKLCQNSVTSLSCGFMIGLVNYVIMGNHFDSMQLL